MVGRRGDTGTNQKTALNWRIRRAVGDALLYLLYPGLCIRAFQQEFSGRDVAATLALLPPSLPRGPKSLSPPGSLHLNRLYSLPLVLVFIHPRWKWRSTLFPLQLTLSALVESSLTQTRCRGAYVRTNWSAAYDILAPPFESGGREHDWLKRWVGF